VTLISLIWLKERLLNLGIISSQLKGVNVKKLKASHSMFLIRKISF